MLIQSIEKVLVSRSKTYHTRRSDVNVIFSPSFKDRTSAVAKQVLNYDSRAVKLRTVLRLLIGEMGRKRPVFIP